MQLDRLRDRQQLARFGGVWTTPGPHGRHPYRSPKLRAVVARVCTGALGLVTALVGLALVLATVLRVPWLSASRLDELESMSPAVRTELLVAGLVGASALAFLAWVVRAYRNLGPLGVRGQRAGTAWATICWFIPLVNLVVPKEIVDDLYRGSDPGAPLLSSAWRLERVPVRVQLWWMSVVGSMVAIPMACLAFTSAYGEGSAVAQATLAIAHLLVAAASFTSCGLVGEVTARQQRRLVRLGTRSAIPVRDDVAPELAPVVDLGRVLVHGGSDVIWGRY